MMAPTAASGRRKSEEMCPQARCDALRVHSGASWRKQKGASSKIPEQVKEPIAVGWGPGRPPGRPPAGPARRDVNVQGVEDDEQERGQ